MTRPDPSPQPPRDYRRVLEGTRTYREELVVRLAGEAGLRPAEMAEIRLGDVQEHERNGDVHYLLAVDGKHGRRLAYLPRDLWDAMEKFARERGRARDESVFDIAPRRIQMLVAGVGERIGDSSVSSRYLRRSFARRLLEDGVDPQVVKTVGGWSSLDTVVDVLESPDAATIVRTFAEERGSADGVRAAEPSPRVEAALDALLTASSALETATTRTEVEAAACESLVDAGFDAAWVLGIPEGSQEANVRVAAGVVDDETLDAESVGLDRPAHVDADADDVRVGRLQDPSAAPGVTPRHVVAEIPIGYGETSYGTLSVATNAVDEIGDRERAVLADLGRRVGQAIAAVTRRRLLRADTVVELEFRTTDERSFLVDAARECDCTFELEGHAPISERSLVLYVRVTGITPETVVDRAQERSGVTRARLIRSNEADAVVELVVDGASVAATLTEYGGNVTELLVDASGAHVTAEFPTEIDVRGVVRGVTAAFPETDLVAKREVSHPVSTDEPLQTRVDGELTDKQRSVLRSAYLAGYFDWPRGTTAEELADALDISSPTLHNHLRKAERTVLDELFGDRSS